MYVKLCKGRNFLWALRCGERHDVTYTPNEISADRRGLTSIVASVIIPKSGNYRRAKITAIIFMFGCQTGPNLFVPHYQPFR
jgi:hypothetical protein